MSGVMEGHRCGPMHANAFQPTFPNSLRLSATA